MSLPRTALALAVALAAASWALPAVADAPAPVAAAEVCPADADTAQATVTAPVQDYAPAPALWKLADEDTTIHIFGTFHILPEGFRWRTALLDRVIAEADEVVFESRDDAEAGAEGAISVEEIRLMTLMLQYRSELPLSQRIAPRNRMKYLRMLDLAGIPPARVEHAPPLLTIFAIEIATAEEEGSRREFGVETVIEAEFKASGRPISAIEDPIAVLTNLLEIDEARLIAMLDKGFDEWDGCSLTSADEVDWESEHSWAQGKLDGAELAEMMEDPFFSAFYEVLLVDRNRAWTEWLAARMAEPGDLLLAVGAGHMEGPDSVILMLEQRGFKVERIQ